MKKKCINGRSFGKNFYNSWELYKALKGKYNFFLVQEYRVWAENQQE